MINEKTKWRCPECETYNTTEVCLICGAPMPLIANATHEEVFVTKVRFSENNKKFPVKTGEKTELMETYDWYCPKCGRGNKDYSRYCNRCGYDRSGIAVRIAVITVAVVFLIIGIILFGMN